MNIPTPGGQNQPQATQEREYNPKFIFGNLTQVPEVKMTNTGSPLTELNVAMTTANGTVFYKVTVWGSVAYYCTNLKKGDKVSAFGNYVKREFQKQDGTIGISHELQSASVYLDFGYILESVASMVGQMIGQSPSAPSTNQSAPAAANNGFQAVERDEELPFN